MKVDVSRLGRHAGLASFRKEKGFYRQIAIVDSRDGSTIVSARFYWPGRDGASNCYACVWIHGDESHGSGGGKAGGYGYHKESAALQVALDRAGVVLDEAIDGRGDQAMFDALESVARAVIKGNRRVFRVMAHA
jgi:hypothetical protein